MTSGTSKESSGIAKALIRSGSHYLMARKRAPNTPKDNRLEHLGGHVEPGETPLQALIRELREEEDSGSLAREAQRQRPEPRTVVLHYEGESEAQFLFDVRIAPDLPSTLRANQTESYAFELVPMAALDTDEGLRGIRARLTPKTIAIYRALGRDV